MHCAKVDSDVLVSSRAKVDREAYDLQRQTGLFARQGTSAGEFI